MNKSVSILTYCSGYPYRVFKRFAGSLFDTGFSGEVYFFIESHDEITLKRLQKKNPNWNIRYVVTSPMFDCQCFRYISYLQFLNKTEIDSDYILLCDSRDVLFQRNIEEYHYSDSELYLFEEPDRKIEDCSINSKWIEFVGHFVEEDDLFGELGEKNVLCSGTTMGTASAIKEYLALISYYLLVPNDGISLKDTVKGIDQGVHNYMFYMDKLSSLNLTVLTNDDNLVNTMGGEYHFLNSDNKIVNKNNDISYIAHQYDRLSDDLKSKLSCKYNFKD